MLSRSLSAAVRTSALRTSVAALPQTRGYASEKPTLRVALTGASGAIGYATLFRIASGAMLGHDQPIELSLLELPQAMKALEGVVMELNDCAFPLLRGIRTSDNAEQAFEGCNVALLVGAKPRGPGMERGDLLRDNGNIFTQQGKALNKTADRSNLKVVVVGNPANTNAWIASQSAPDIDPKCFTAMTRLDHNRGLAQLAERLGCRVTDIEKFCIWGNHSSTQYPDVTQGTVKGTSLKQAIGDDEWVKNTFIPTVQKRGAAIIAARGASSAASAGSSAIDHIRDWVHGTDGQWTSMAIPSDGSYNTTPGLFYSFPVVCKNGQYEIVQGLQVDAFSRERMDITNKELEEERDTVIRELGL